MTADSLEAAAHYSDLRNWNIAVRKVSFPTSTAILCAILVQARYECEGYKYVIASKAGGI